VLPALIGTPVTCMCSDVLIERYVLIKIDTYLVLVLLMPRKDGTWRMCIDSCVIKNDNGKVPFSHSRLNDMLDMMSEAKIFSKIDVKSGYHQIHIHPRDEWKITFKTEDGLY